MFYDTNIWDPYSDMYMKGDMNKIAQFQRTIVFVLFQDKRTLAWILIIIFTCYDNYNIKWNSAVIYFILFNIFGNKIFIGNNDPPLNN